MNNEDLLDLFAGMAMQGLIASGNYSLNSIAELSYQMAESMVHEKEDCHERKKNRPE